MSKAFEFSKEEFTQIYKGPISAGMTIIGSDFSITSMLKEFKALTAAMKGFAGQHASSSSFMAYFQDQLVNHKEEIEAEMKKAQEREKGGEQQEDFAGVVSGALDLLKKKGVSASDTKLYAQMCYNVAEEVAKAAKEGGFLGIGGKEVVSAKEAEALAKLKTTLGL